MCVALHPACSSTFLRMVSMRFVFIATALPYLQRRKLRQVRPQSNRLRLRSRGSADEVSRLHPTPHPQGARTVTCRMRGRNCTEEQSKKLIEMREKLLAGRNQL